MLSKAEEIALEHWRTVRSRALDAHQKLDAHAPDVEHDLPGLISSCEKAIKGLETKARLP